MKLKIDKKYIIWGLTAFIVIVLSICFIYLIYNGNIFFDKIKNILHICMPIIDGLVLAYLLAPIVNFVETKCLTPCYNRFHVKIERKTKSRMRIFSICFALIFVLLIAYSFFSIVLPQIYRSIQSIVVHFPSYIDNFINYANKLLQDNPEFERSITGIIDKYSAELTSWLNARLLPSMNELIKNFSLSILSFLVGMWNVIIGLIISIYVLANKEKFLGQTKKMIYSFMTRERANNFLADMRFVNKTFGGFISGKLIDSLIIGILCFICLSIIGTPYPILISVIVGVTNIIPFFGPYLGAIPSAILILLIDPVPCLYFLIFILILQQFDGNFLGPKILGSSTGLSGFWVIFSITIFGGLFGVLGMLLGVPTFAVIYAFFRRKIQKRLISKGLPIATKPYINLQSISVEDELVMYTDSHHSSPDTLLAETSFINTESEDSPLLKKIPLKDVDLLNSMEQVKKPSKKMHVRIEQTFKKFIAFIKRLNK